MRGLPYILTLSSLGCAAAPVPVRVLHTEAPHTQLPEPAPARTAPESGTPKPRIGPPGGSGAGSRRVLPAQSGNETVGGLPAGTGGGKGPAGRG
jgi:hypothetical protein